MIPSRCILSGFSFPTSQSVSEGFDLPEELIYNDPIILNECLSKFIPSGSGVLWDSGNLRSAINLEKDLAQLDNGIGLDIRLSPGPNPLIYSAISGIVPHDNILVISTRNTMFESLLEFLGSYHKIPDGNLFLDSIPGQEPIQLFPGDFLNKLSAHQLNKLIYVNIR